MVARKLPGGTEALDELWTTVKDGPREIGGLELPLANFVVPPERPHFAFAGIDVHRRMFYYVYNYHTNNSIAIIHFTGKEPVIRYRPNSAYAEQMKGWAKKSVPSDRVHTNRERVRSVASDLLARAANRSSLQDAQIRWGQSTEAVVDTFHYIDPNAYRRNLFTDDTEGDS